MQLRQLALIGERYDRGYGHFTTRQNLQFNCRSCAISRIFLDLLADVGMHCIQTSGNCIRNVTADHFAVLPRPMRWKTPAPPPSSFASGHHSIRSFDFLPRKFKIAVTGAPEDRAAIRAHDIGSRCCATPIRARSAIRVLVGGGLDARR